jgi:hypothetical protein
VSRNRAGFLVGLALALLLLAPLLGRGVVLSRDMVFVDGIPLGRQLLGLLGVPRAVPSDLLVALGSRVVGAAVLQAVVLTALVVTAAWGATRLAATRSTLAACAAGTAYGWAPYLHERLLLGHWALLVGWAVLPWAVRAALDWRAGRPGAPTVAWLAVAALGGASALLLVALSVLVCCPRLRVLAATAVLSLPWALPGLLADVAAGDPRGVEAFAARSDTPLGVVGSLLTGGGVWAPAAVPPGRAAGVGVGVLVLLVAARGVRRVPVPLRTAGAVGLVLAVAGRTPGLDAVLRWAVVHVPAAGLLRDGQKWLAPFVLLVALGLAHGVDELRVPVRRTALVAAALAPLAALPGAAWAVQGRLVASTVPADWRQVTGQAEGDVLVLPWAHYRAFAWNGDRTVLDPATKLLVRPVVNDALPLRSGDVAGEDPLAARLDRVARSGEPLLAELQENGVDQVLVERSTRGFDAGTAARQTEGLQLVVQTRELALYAVPGADGEVGGAAPLWPVLLGDVLALGLAGAAVVRRRGYLPAS